MKNETGIVSFTAAQLKAKRERGDDLTDWDRAKGMGEAELEAAIASDAGEAAIQWDWSTARIEPVTKTPTTMRLDNDVLAFFKSTGRGWQTRINALLRSYMEHQQR